MSFFPTENSINYVTVSNEDFEQSNDYAAINVGASLKFVDDQNPSRIEAKQNFGFPTFNTGEYYNDNQNQNYINTGDYYNENGNPNYDGSPVNNRPPVPYRRPQQPQQPPKGQQQSNYAQYFNYQNPQRPPQSQNYRPQYYQGNDVNYRPGPPPGYNQQNYAGNYNNYDSGNPLTSFISNLGQGASDLIYGTRPSQAGPTLGQPTFGQQQFSRPGPSASPTDFGPLGQFGKAIEEITRHDDLQCIPKIICQMVGAQRRQNSISPLLGSPVFSS